MTRELRDQIHDSLNLKETDELLEIWQVNDRTEWSDLAFEVIQEILRQRLGDEIPPQDEPLYTPTEPADEDDLREDERDGTFLDDENAPVFYEPRSVIQLANWLLWAATAAVIMSAIWNTLQIPNIARNQFSYFFPYPSTNFLAYLLALIVAILDTALTAIMTYIPLKALSQILNILMEMEFNSRGVN